MTWPVTLRPAAKAEFDEAQGYYEDKRAGLGDEFAECVQEALDRIAINPEIHAKVYKEVRKGIVRRFPYVLYYRKNVNEVEVISVFHTKRNPKNWKKRANLDNGG